MLVGVDIGGTFTDFVFSVNGRLQIHKQLSTPQNPAQAMLDGLSNAIPGGLTAPDQIAHGSTVATNAILERNGARLAFITTGGFRDILAIARQNRPDLYALHPTLSAPLVPRERTYDVPERLDHSGDVLTPLDTDALERILNSIEKQNVDAVAVCLLYSFINPQHEEAIKARILERGLLDDWQIVLSNEVLPEFREYERASTTVLEAYVRPIMTRYLRHLVDELPDEMPLRIMKSDGGVMSADRVQKKALHTALSGPAAGVMGAFHLAKMAGFERIITLDMGGTSTDVALCPGEPQMSPDSQIDGLPLRARLLDIETIGAGGGSIARVDAGGALRVGPQSAGADPGPIVYGQGGEQITVSDASVILGRLDAEHFLGGEMSLEVEAAETAFDALAAQIDFSRVEAARGVIDVANVNIDRAVRRVSVARGHDPRQFTLVAFGGAGPLHACEVAERLDMPRVLIPRYPGVLCALGLLVADVKVSHSYPVLVKASRNMLARLRAMQAELLSMARDDLRAEGIADEDMDFTILLDMRYEGQAHELTVPFMGNVIQAFHSAHEDAYGHAIESRRVEIVNMRVEASGYVTKPQIDTEAPQGSSPDAAYLGDKKSPLGGIMSLYEREQLPPGARFKGEALVFQFDSTVYVAQGWEARVDGYRNLILERI